MFPFRSDYAISEGFICTVVACGQNENSVGEQQASSGQALTQKMEGGENTPLEIGLLEVSEGGVVRFQNGHPSPPRLMTGEEEGR